ncbi:AaceriAGR193Cp [[Ashbya] aceris (nom. inval.)]|nr:AaceriAGR193Cp [[Ashbya] aceris (nom. inval.)]
MFSCLAPLRNCGLRQVVQAFHGVRTLATARKTVKPLTSRKTLLIDQYKQLMETNPLAVFLHYNNLLKTEDAHFRGEIQKLGGRLTVVRNRLFQVYLRKSRHADPAAHVSPREQDWGHPLLPLFKGPTAVVTFPETDPQAVAKLLKLLERAQDKMFIVGARAESEVFDVARLNDFKQLPSKSTLQSQLLGVLHVLSGAGLVRTLESGSQTLYMTLKGREKQLLGPEDDSAAEK